jgi:hypothetical protein
MTVFSDESGGVIALTDKAGAVQPRYSFETVGHRVDHLRSEDRTQTEMICIPSN